MFQVDFGKLVAWLTPVWLRYANVLLLVRCWNWPIRQVYGKLEAYRRTKVYRLSHNSQVCYMQKVLNDRFDGSLRRIVVSDFAGQDRIYLWSDAAERDVYLGVEFIYPESAYADSGVDFTVLLPVDVAVSNSDFQNLIALINEYRLAGKSFNIVRL